MDARVAGRRYATRLSRRRQGFHCRGARKHKSPATDKHRSYCDCRPV